MKERKVNCYECKYGEPIPGSAHLRCRHPANIEILDNPLTQMLGILASTGRSPAMVVETKLRIKYNSYGVRMGWFNWPLNFDPIWLKDCDGYNPKTAPEKEVEK